jgi:hypothetical protein
MDLRQHSADAENPATSLEKPSTAPRRGLLSERAVPNAGPVAAAAAPAFPGGEDGEPEYTSVPTWQVAPPARAPPTPWECGFAVPLPSVARLRAASALLAVAPGDAAAAAAGGEEPTAGAAAAAAGAPLAARARLARGGGAAALLGEEGGALFAAVAAGGERGAWAAALCGDTRLGDGGELLTGGGEDTRLGDGGDLLTEGGDAASPQLAAFSLGAFV